VRTQRAFIEAGGAENAVCRLFSIPAYVQDLPAPVYLPRLPAYTCRVYRQVASYL